MLNDPVMHRLVGVTIIEMDDAMTQAYPGKQGGEVELRDTSGAIHRGTWKTSSTRAIADVRGEISRRAAEDVLGAAAPRAKSKRCIDGLERSDDAGLPWRHVCACGARRRIGFEARAAAVVTRRLS